MAERYEMMLKKQQEDLRKAQYEYKKAQAQFQARLYGIHGLYLSVPPEPPRHGK
jgi:hypothetical protein